MVDGQEGGVEQDEQGKIDSGVEENLGSGDDSVKAQGVPLIVGQSNEGSVCGECAIVSVQVKQIQEVRDEAEKGKEVMNTEKAW